MDDSWSFRTESGRAGVSGGRLRVERTVSGLLRSTYHEGWTENGATRRLFFLFSMGGTMLWFKRVIPALEAVAGSGPVESIQWFVLAATAVVVLTMVRSVGRSKQVPLESVEAVRRDDRELTVEYVEGGNVHTFDVEALTDDDAEEAVEILGLKGVDVRSGGGDSDEGGTRFADFRERLAKKARDRA